MSVSAPIGREIEFGRLQALIEKVKAGERLGALITGPAGVGKTTLLRALRASAVARGWPTSFVRVPDIGGLAPRFPLAEVLGGLAASLEHDGHPAPEAPRKVLDTLSGLTSAEEYPAELPQIVEALESIGARGPIAVLIDDLTRIPADAAKLLLAALRAAEVPLLFACTARTPTDALPESDADLWFDRIEVLGLHEDDVAALASSVLGGRVLPSVARLLHQRTLGNPLYVIETVRQWRDERALLTVGEHWALAGAATPTPLSLRDTIAARLRRLRSDERLVVQTLAVLGRDASFNELGRFTSMQRVDLIAAVSALAKHELLIEDAGSRPFYRLAHPLHGEAALSELGETGRAVLHGMILSGLRASSSVAASELAHHGAAALDRPNDMVSLLQGAAAEAEGIGSHEEAARWYGLLASEADASVEARAGAKEHQAVATANFDPREAIRLFGEALEEMAPSGGQRSGMLRHRAMAYRFVGEFDNAERDLSDALPDASQADNLEIRHAKAVLHGIRGAIDDAERELVALEEDSRGTPTHAKAIGHLGMVAYVRGELKRARSLWEESLAEVSDPDYRAYVEGNLIAVLGRTGHLGMAHEIVKVAATTAMKRGDSWNAASFLCHLSGHHYLWGESGPAIDYATQAFKLAKLLGSPAGQLEARVHLATALEDSGDPGAAIQALAGLQASDCLNMELREPTSACCEIGEIYLSAGRLPEASAFLEVARKHLDGNVPSRIFIACLDAAIALEARDFERALAVLEPWIAGGSELPFPLANAYWIASQAAADIGRRDIALGYAAEAENLYRQLEAKHRAQRVRDWALTHLQRRGRPKSQLPCGLTEREIEVATLAARGLTDRETAARLFISVGTAKKHLEHARQKLGISRRSQIGARLHSLGMDLDTHTGDVFST